MRLIIPCVTMLTLVCVTSLYAESTALDDAVMVYTGSTVLDIGKDSVPTVADWDNDGSEDLIVGGGSEGALRVYSNLGSNMKRVFGGYFRPESEGLYIYDPGSG